MMMADPSSLQQLQSQQLTEMIHTKTSMQTAKAKLANRAESRNLSLSQTSKKQQREKQNL